LLGILKSFSDLRLLVMALHYHGITLLDRAYSIS
jgi:hypothetical protein